MQVSNWSFFTPGWEAKTPALVATALLGMGVSVAGTDPGQARAYLSAGGGRDHPRCLRRLLQGAATSTAAMFLLAYRTECS